MNRRHPEMFVRIPFLQHTKNKMLDSDLNRLYLNEC